MLRLFIASTPYHLMIACELYQQGDKLIIVSELAKSEILLRMIRCTFGDYVEIHSLYYYKTKPYKLLSFQRSVEKEIYTIRAEQFQEIYVFNDLDPVVQWILAHIQHSSIILVEEGIGLYRNSIKRHKEILKRYGKFLFGEFYEEVDRIGETSFIDTIICSAPQYLSVKQCEKHINNLKKINFNSLSKRLKIKKIYNKAWFIGQPLVEDGVISEERYMQGIFTLSKTLEKEGMKLIVKPHPRENIDKYKNKFALVTDNTIPIELLVDNSYLTLIFTYYSSAILSLAKMTNIKTYMLCGMYKEINLDSNVIKLFKENGVCEYNL